MTDYAAIYSTYWEDPARWGSCSLRDVEQTGEVVLGTCGPGRVLDVGCGMGSLVRALLRHGVDAHGLDVAQRCVDEGNRHAPGRFVRGSLLELPFADGAFETVVSTDVLEHLAEEDVPRAIAEMARVARRGVFLRVATTRDRDGSWHLTVRDRAWWEQRCFEAGLRRHPLLLSAVPYEALEAEGWQATLVMERVPAGALARWPLEALRAERDLHMDMLREAGRRSDAHLARYHLACQFVRPGDVVLDAACGLGYGGAVLAAGSQASRVIGLDESESAVEYAAASYGGGAVEFRRGDAQDLSWLADASVDVVVSFETLEHLAEPERFLDGARRVLRPGGRIVVSVPNEWTDETGKDPNPHHLQVYNWERLGAEIGARFILERRYGQVAGGGMKLRDGARRLREDAIGSMAPAPSRGAAPGQPGQAEWWLAVGMKEPVGAAREGYAQTGYPDHSGVPGYHVGAFGRDYENPWLVRAMVALGLRCTSKAELGLMAERAAQAAEGTEAGRSSADLGAALCVLGYRLLESGPVEVVEAERLLARLGAYESAVGGAGSGATAHARRWVISNAYVAGQVLLAIGRRAEARAEFRRCAGMDVLVFSPLLASKTIDASYHAGLIAACDGDADGAVEDFARGLSELVRVLGAGDWTNIIGTVEEPLSFGLVDLQQGVELASRCAFGVACVGMLRDRPGLAWTLLRRRAMADLKRWSEQQTGAMEWLREQRREFERALGEAREWIGRQEKGRAWLEEQRQELEQQRAGLAARVESLSREAADERERLRGVVSEQRRAGEWLAVQKRELEARLRERDATIAELRAYIESQKSGEKWLAGQKQELEARLGQRDVTIAELQGKVAKLIEGREWAAKQAAAWRAKVEEVTKQPTSREGGRAE